MNYLFVTPKIARKKKQLTIIDCIALSKGTGY